MNFVYKIYWNALQFTSPGSGSQVAVTVATITSVFTQRKTSVATTITTTVLNLQSSIQIVNIERKYNYLLCGYYLSVNLYSAECMWRSKSKA